METNELKRANDLKELELKLHIWEEFHRMGKTRDGDYLDVLKWALNTLCHKEES